MPGALALVLAAALTSLPPLPQRGLALETKAGVELQSLDGPPLATLRGLDLAPDQALAHKAVFRDGRGRLFVLAGGRLRRAPLRRGCRATDVQLTVCPRAIRGAAGVLARAPQAVGHWVWAERSPSGNAVLAQWSAECEVPVAYLIAKGKLRAYGAETVALGWLPTGEAVVHFRPLGCVGSGRRGIYAVPRKGKPRLLLRTARFAQYLMWGG
ncbi:MAG: hypothetical protein AUG91_06340 [Actinobacteria bacterium 13_1_20CM_4_69_9]|nr:MAG: hypothetical protein AUG91_06340 [Actinobacteria bacterium 13_1_20CM_4_69_9]